MSVIRVQNLSRKYKFLNALDQITFNLESGRIVGLIGQNGSGKTTLFKILAGLEMAYDGDVTIEGQVPGHKSKAIVSFLPDKNYLNLRNTTSQLFKFHQDFYPDFNMAKATDMLAQFGISNQQRLDEMSLGMQEKVQVTLIMSREAKVYLLDEPISGVDPIARKQIIQGIIKNYSENSLLVISSHLVHEIEPILDEIILLKQGRILMHENVEDLRAKYKKSIEEIYMES